MNTENTFKLSDLFNLNFTIQRAYFNESAFKVK